MNVKIDIIVSGHEPLVKYLREEGIVDESTPWVKHATIDDVKGRHVLGTLPAHLAARCRSFTEIPLHFSPEDREAMRRGDLPVARVRACAGKPVTYCPPRVGEPDLAFELAECHRRALDHCSPFAWPPNMSAAQGVVEYASAEGLDHAQVDVYARGRPRYRTLSMGGQWSPWLTWDGALCAEQDEPKANDRGYWAREGTIPLSEAPDGARVEIWDLRVDMTDKARIGTVESHEGDHVLVRIDGQRYPRRHVATEPCKVIGPKLYAHAGVIDG